MINIYVSVHSEQMKDCSRTGYIHVTGHQQGHLSSLDSSLNCPYRLEVAAGQRLNLTLMDFRSNVRNASHDYAMSKFCEQVNLRQMHNYRYVTYQHYHY